MNNVIERETTPLEKAVFLHLDILYKENKSKVSINSIRKKWSHLSTDDARNLLEWWNKNSPKKDYKFIVSRTF